MSRTQFLNLAHSRDLELAQLMARLWGIKPAVIDLWTIAASRHN